MNHKIMRDHWHKEQIYPSIPDPEDNKLLTKKTQFLNRLRRHLVILRMKQQFFRNRQLDQQIRLRNLN